MTTLQWTSKVPTGIPIVLGTGRVVENRFSLGNLRQYIVDDYPEYVKLGLFTWEDIHAYLRSKA